MGRIIGAGLAGAALLALASCAGTEGQSASTRVLLGLANLPDTLLARPAVEDAPFGAHRLALDLYRPDGAAPEGGWPLVVFFYGGAWQTGERGQYAFAATALAEAGFVAAVPDYRKYPAVRFPAFMRDAAAAVATARALAPGHGGDPDRVLLVGHSAGGHMAALLAYDRRYLVEAGVAPAAIAGVAGLAGPYDFTPQAEDIRAIFGPPERYPAMRTGRFVAPGGPPILMQLGAEDAVVGRVNIERLSAALVEAGVCHASAIYPGLDHAGLVAELT
ncbi:MAG: alpha/beta hydrolase [Paracoccaceae bacterium]